MRNNNSLEGRNVIIALNNTDERMLVKELMEKTGAASVEYAGNTLEMVLAALDHEDVILITEAGEGVLDITDALNYITENSRYTTVTVISDKWSQESREELLGAVDVFVARPVLERNLIPGILVDAARKMRMRDLEKEYIESEESFARDKNRSFAEHVIMDTLGLSKESAGEYIKTLAEKYGYDEGEVSKIVYEVQLTGRKQ